MKKIILLFIFTLSLCSCASDSAADEPITYADTKPTQSKYKAFYGESLTKSTSITSGSVETAVTTLKPISVIIYPLTNTISFSNIFDTTTVEYPITTKGEIGSKRIYGFKMNGVTYHCTIIEETESTAMSTILITIENENYNFNVTKIEKKRISKLLTKEVQTSPNIKNNYSKEYQYVDTLLLVVTHRYKNPNTLEDLTRFNIYNYKGSKLISKEILDSNSILTTKVKYNYENDLIVKAIFTDVADKQTSVTKYQYDALGRITGIFMGGNTAETNFSLIRYHTYEKNKLLTVFTDSKGTDTETEVSIYDEERKLISLTPDQKLDPFLSLPITKTTYTNSDGQVFVYPGRTFEFSNEGYLLKMLSEDNVTEYFYTEEL